MAEAYQASQQDLRNLGAMVNRLLDDLNRPDLQAQALEYVQDAIRYYQRLPWLFNETDNTPTAVYANSTIYPQGSIIQATISGTQYAFCALNYGTSASAGTPAWPATIFTVPSSGTPPPTAGTAGTVVDNTITWGNVGLWASTTWTQLATVYRVNQVVPPLDYVAPKRIEVTAANLRFELQWIPYGQLRDYDVIRPAPITVYPTFWSWFQQQIYMWPYPNAFYPLTLSYRTAPVMLSTTNQTSFWTTQAEAMVRAEAARRICMNVTHEPDLADVFLAVRKDEERALRSQAIAQRSPANSGIPASDW